MSGEWLSEGLNILFQGSGKPSITLEWLPKSSASMTRRRCNSTSSCGVSAVVKTRSCGALFVVLPPPTQDVQNMWMLLAS